MMASTFVETFDVYIKNNLAVAKLKTSSGYIVFKDKNKEMTRSHHPPVVLSSCEQISEREPAI